MIFDDLFDIPLTSAAQLDFKVLFVPIKPTIKNSASFACPITASDISVGNLTHPRHHRAHCVPRAS